MNRLQKQKIDGLEVVGNIEVPYALAGIRHGTLRLKLKRDSIPTISNGAVPAFVNVQLIAALDGKGIVHLYTIANFPLPLSFKPKTATKQKKSKSKSKAKSKTSSERDKEAPTFVSAWSNMKEAMSFSLEHQNVVDFTIDTSDSNRIVLVSVGSDGSVHTTVLGLQVYNGKEFIGQVLPVAISKNTPVTAPVPVEMKNETVTSLELGVDGSEQDSSETTTTTTISPKTPPKTPKGKDTTIRSESSILMSKLDAQYEHFRTYLKIKYGSTKSNYRHSIHAYGDNDRNFHNVKPDRAPEPEQRDPEAPMPLELFVSLAGHVSEKSNILHSSMSICSARQFTPTSLMVIPAAVPLGLTKRERAMLAGSLSSHTYIIGLKTDSVNISECTSYPVLIYTQPNGTIIHSVYNTIPTPNSMVDMAPIHGLDIMVGISAMNELHIISTKNKKIINSTDTERHIGTGAVYGYDSWYLDADDCIDLNIEHGWSGYSHQPHDHYQQILAVKPTPTLAKDTLHPDDRDETAITLSILMKSGIVNVYTLRRFDTGAVKEGAVSISSGSDNETVEEETQNVTHTARGDMYTRRHFRCYYSGTIDPPFHRQHSISTDTSTDVSSSAFRSSHMVLLNHPHSGLARRNTAPNHPVHSNVLISSSDQCGISLYNVSMSNDYQEISTSINTGSGSGVGAAAPSMHLPFELSDDILMFRRKFATDCLLPQHLDLAKFDFPIDSGGMGLTTGVEVYSLSHLTSSSGTSGAIAQPPSVAAPKKGRSGILSNTAKKKQKPASIAQRRKGGGAPSLNPDAKTTNNDLFQAELPLHYNNLIIGYNSFNTTINNTATGLDLNEVHGRILFYDQMTSVQYIPPSDDMWTTLSQYGVLFAVLVLGAIYKFFYKGKGSGKSSKRGLFGQKKTGYGKESASLHNKFGTKHSPNQHQRFLGSDSEDDYGTDGRNDAMGHEEKKSVNKLMERATALQKIIDEAEYAANMARNKNSYNNRNKSGNGSGGMGLPNSSRVNKLRRDRYDEPDRFTDFD